MSSPASGGLRLDPTRPDLVYGRQREHRFMHTLRKSPYPGWAGTAGLLALDAARGKKNP